MTDENETEQRWGITDLLVIQPTPFCNIDCSYCYLPHRTSTKTLSVQVAEHIFQKLVTFPTIQDSLSVVWHAGEPMTLGPGYYDEMFTSIQRLTKSKIQVRHNFQTNGTLITDAWCDLIQKWEVDIGVSIDGPAEFHDLYRRYRNGAGSFAKAYAGLKLLQSRGIPFHVISVLTLSSLEHPDKMFDFYEQAGIDTVCFNIEENHAYHTSSQLVASPKFERLHRSFMARFFELCTMRGTSMTVREFDNALRAIQGYGRDYRNQQNDPFGIISIDCEGNLSTFSPELLSAVHPAYGSFVFGNVLKDDFETIAKRLKDSRVYADIQAGRRKCGEECEYYKMCGGGSPANKIYENGSANSTETVHCQAYQIAIDVVLDLIERIPEAACAIHERISAIAIRDNESSDDNSIWSAKGVTHADLREEAASNLGLAAQDFERFEDGFLTSNGRFVDRQEAARIAMEAAQAKQQLHEDSEGLYLQHCDLLSDSSKT